LIIKSEAPRCSVVDLLRNTDWTAMNAEMDQSRVQKQGSKKVAPSTNTLSSIISLTVSTFPSISQVQSLLSMTSCHRLRNHPSLLRLSRL
jgi:2-keto-4-pentenoate hydratase